MYGYLTSDIISFEIGRIWIQTNIWYHGEGLSPISSLNRNDISILPSIEELVEIEKGRVYDYTPILTKYGIVEASYKNDYELNGIMPYVHFTDPTLCSFDYMTIWGSYENLPNNLIEAPIGLSVLNFKKTIICNSYYNDWITTTDADVDLTLNKISNSEFTVRQTYNSVICTYTKG